jgi:hypothetical protein
MNGTNHQTLAIAIHMMDLIFKFIIDKMECKLSNLIKNQLNNKGKLLQFLNKKIHLKKVDLL